MDEHHVRITRKTQYSRKWEVVLFSIPSIVTAYFCFDQPSALYDVLVEHLDVGYEGFHIVYALLYLVYSVTLIVLPILSGGVRDTKGDRYMLNLLGLLVIVGQLAFTMGVLYRSIMIIILGRLLLCWGVQSLIPLHSSYFSQYFREGSIVFEYLYIYIFIYI